MMKNHTEESMDIQMTEPKEHAIRTGHISRDLFCDWQEGKLKGREETDFFTHIGACTFCAEQFGNWMEEGFLKIAGSELFSGAEEEPERREPAHLKEPSGNIDRIQGSGAGKRREFSEEPPRYLKEEILSRTRQIDVQASVKLKETSRQVQLMIYSLKVGLAVAASIFLLTVTSNIQNLDVNPQMPENQQMEQEKRDQKREESIAKKLRQGSKEITTILNELSSGLFRIDMDTSENERNQEVTR